MTEEPQNIDLQKDAEVKIAKLREVVEDILEHGTMAGDQTARHLVITAITKSDSEFLNEKLEEILLDESEKELMRTMVCGFFLQKERYAPLIEYSNKVVPDSLILSEEFEERESLLLVLDALVKAADSENEYISQDALDALIKLYKASCSQHSKALIADQLLQRLISILPQRSERINNSLLKIILDKEAGINSRIVAIDILARGRSEALYMIIENILFDMDSYASSEEDKLYMLDVITKALANYSLGQYSQRLRMMLAELNGLDFVVKEDNEYVAAICKRIKSRLKNLNDELNSMN